MVQFDSTRLAAICQEHGVSGLRVFGSAAHGEERADSDLDLMRDDVLASARDLFHDAAA